MQRLFKKLIRKFKIYEYENEILREYEVDFTSMLSSSDRLRFDIADFILPPLCHPLSLLSAILQPFFALFILPPLCHPLSSMNEGGVDINMVDLCIEVNRELSNRDLELLQNSDCVVQIC
ncbi:hypothetical protein LR48_Vigan07g184900 [Vigna angularis]|uniref:Uncharacterized protein n=1 Tax=Phaseolus angularis TaxID=3914 RepID=A0A0L9UZ57_PHAAN|nr:hypothetical protein LR48_Vigan07g184900 [Vigna angularis]